MIETIKTFLSSENLYEDGIFPMNLSGIGFVVIAALLAILIGGEIISRCSKHDSWLF